MISKTNINSTKIDYEEYLTELLNMSKYFMSLTNGIKFKKILNQSHGESDVVADNYEIDFKLLVNKEFVNAKLKSLPNVDYSHIKNGFICVNDKIVNENILTQTQSNKLFIQFLKILASTKKDQIESYKDGKEYYLYSTIKMLKKEKNLLVFLPCIINMTGGKRISNIIGKVLSSLFSLRDIINKDTYVTLLSSDGFFYIFKYKNGVFYNVDKVYKFFVSSFIDIYRRTYFLEDN